jgi:hypothetical protein
MFPRSIYLENKLYKLCSLNDICKEIAAIKCITVRHKKFHSDNVDGPYATIVRLILESSGE